MLRRAVTLAAALALILVSVSLLVARRDRGCVERFGGDIAPAVTQMAQTLTRLLLDAGMASVMGGAALEQALALPSDAELKCAANAGRVCQAQNSAE